MEAYDQFIADCEAKGEAEVRKLLAQGAFVERKLRWVNEWLAAQDRARSEAAQADSNSLASRAASAAERSADAAERANKIAQRANAIAIAAAVIAMGALIVSAWPHIQSIITQG